MIEEEIKRLRTALEQSCDVYIELYVEWHSKYIRLHEAYHKVLSLVPVDKVLRAYYNLDKYGCQFCEGETE